MENSSHQARFADLQARFVRRLKDEQAQLTELLAELNDAGASEAALAKLAAHMHRYKGNGQSFGFPEISKRAQAVEEAIEQTPLNSPAILKAYAPLQELILSLTAGS